MSLLIGIDDGHGHVDVQRPFVELDNDGYYWVLHPYLLALHKRSGQYVDLYGDARFSGEGLQMLSDTLAEATRAVQTHPTTWNVAVSIDSPPAYATVERDRFVAVLTAFQRIVSTAEREEGGIVCFGD